LNFKFVILLLFVLAGCGVKGPPLKYPDTVMQSYIDDYTGEKGELPAKPQYEDKSAVPAPKN